MTNELNAKLPPCPKCGIDGDTFTRCAKSSCYAADCPAHERALNIPGMDAQGVVADVIWRIDNEAAQFIDKDGMVYLRYLRDLLANQRPAPTGVYAAGKVEALLSALDQWFLHHSAEAHDRVYAARAALAEGEKGNG